MDQVKGQKLTRELPDAERTKLQKVDKAWVAITAKILLVPFLLFISLVIGLAIGYSVIGKMPVSEVFDLETYTHMYDLIFSGTQKEAP